MVTDLVISETVFKGIDAESDNSTDDYHLAGHDNSFFYLSRTPESISPNYFLRGKLRAGKMESSQCFDPSCSPCLTALLSANSGMSLPARFLERRDTRQ